MALASIATECCVPVKKALCAGPQLYVEPVKRKWPPLLAAI